MEDFSIWICVLLLLCIDTTRLDIGNGRSWCVILLDDLQVVKWPVTEYTALVLYRSYGRRGIELRPVRIII